MSQRELIIVTSCTATKAGGANGARPARRPAESLYAGQQHVRLMRGVRAYRRAGQPAGALRLRIVSAGHGLIAGGTRVESYDETFQGLGREQIRVRAADLRVPARLRSLLRRRYGLAVLLLGDDYLEACQLDLDLQLGGPTIALCGPQIGLRVPPVARLRVIGLGTAEARRFACPLVSLKGELGGRLLTALATRPAAVAQLGKSDFDVLDWLDSAGPTSASGKAAAGTRSS